MPTTSMFSFVQAARNTRRPIRPKPLIPILIVAIILTNYLLVKNCVIFFTAQKYILSVVYANKLLKFFRYPCALQISCDFHRGTAACRRPLQRIPEPVPHLFGPLSLLLLGPRSHNYSVHTPRSTSALPGSSSIRTPCSSPARTRTGTPHGSPVIYIIRKNRQNVLSEAGKIFRLP